MTVVNQLYRTVQSYTDVDHNNDDFDQELWSVMMMMNQLGMMMIYVLLESGFNLLDLLSWQLIYSAYKALSIVLCVNNSCRASSWPCNSLP